MPYPHASLRLALVALIPTALMGTTIAPAEAAALDPFFSEYVEGSSNNKAVEIYNPGTEAVDLSSFFVALYTNGKTTASSFALSGLLSPGDVFVLGSSRASADIQSVSDLTWGSLNFNGDDAIALVRDDVLLDVIGRIGEDPGDFWGTDPITTQDHTLVRMASITQGDSNGSDAFDPASQWIGDVQNTISGLGSHTVNSVPVPATLPLLMSGLGLLFATRKRTAFRQIELPA